MTHVIAQTGEVSSNVGETSLYKVSDGALGGISNMFRFLKATVTADDNSQDTVNTFTWGSTSYGNGPTSWATVAGKNITINEAGLYLIGVTFFATPNTNYAYNVGCRLNSSVQGILSGLTRIVQYYYASMHKYSFPWVGYLSVGEVITLIHTGTGFADSSFENTIPWPAGTTLEIVRLR